MQTLSKIEEGLINFDKNYKNEILNRIKFYLYNKYSR
jgi:hypothetical protein